LWHEPIDPGVLVAALKVADPWHVLEDWRDFQNFVGETVGEYREEMRFICTHRRMWRI
jgi:hypothetical protein